MTGARRRTYHGECLLGGGATTGLGVLPGGATGLRKIRKIRKKSARTAQALTTASTTERFCEPV